GTFGAGGYSTAILESANCRLFAIDRDQTALARGEHLAQKYGDRFVRLHGCFGDVESLLAAHDTDMLDGLVVDLGVSSMQLDEAERGFSFRFDAPLDMRMDRDSGLTAADIIRTTEQDDLANIIYQYGEERMSRRIAKAIVEHRALSPIETTAQLAAIVRKVIPRGPKDQIDPATRTFQALRIAVNDELGEVHRVLAAAERLLRVGGRLVVVSFHSLEDGIAKQFLTDRSGRGARGSRFLPESVSDLSDPTFTLPTKKAIFPSESEIALNPRSRSARMRVGIRTAAPARIDNGGSA
ncbi:MAG: 16S rRNA (cytosine(1402)-N(4))-methyltransferase RsmH, partial [Alphaproteobacteria bacterium]|nr:16S rRNA (cytosine(1402)-N(4))-methyltransferase RsmH [Alphaproteobacteria bacterium]